MVPGLYQKELDLNISNIDVINWLKAYGQVIEEQKDYLTELDSVIGDADHGANMHRGFQAVLPKIASAEDKDIGMILKTTGMTLLSTVGGAGGPLYSTIFIQAGNTIGGKEEMTLSDWAEALEAARNGVVKLGKAELGDKTMVDALLPAARALQEAASDGSDTTEAVGRASQEALRGARETIPLTARRGRASYLGERSRGHQDPGATSSFLIIEALHLVIAADASPSKKG